MWVVTFGDLISLLVTFFILLFAFSAVDVDKLRRVTGALTGSLGVMTPKQKKSKQSPFKLNVPSNVKTDLKGAESHPKRQELEERMSTAIQDPSVFDRKVDFSKMPDGYRIRMDGRHFFLPGGTRLKSTGRDVLLEVARFFKDEPVRIVIEAHTDSKTSDLVPGQDALTLTRKSAFEMAKFLGRETAWEPWRIGAAGLGAAVPIADNETEIGRRKNRRIEIQVIWDPDGKGHL